MRNTWSKHIGSSLALYGVISSENKILVFNALEKYFMTTVKINLSRWNRKLSKTNLRFKFKIYVNTLTSLCLNSYDYLASWPVFSQMD